MVVEFDDPSYEELKELVAAQQLLIEQQTARIAELEAKIAELERRVGRTPRNSSMPPSAEGLSKPPAEPRRAPGAGQAPARASNPATRAITSPR